MAIFIIPISTRECRHGLVRSVWLRNGLCTRSSGRRIFDVSDRQVRIMGASRLEERGVGRYAALSYLHGNFEPLVPGLCYSSLWHPGDGLGDCTGHPAARWISNAHGSKISAWLTLGFAIGMTAGTGITSALNASVIAFSACGWLLAKAERYPVSFDALRKG